MDAGGLAMSNTITHLIRSAMYCLPGLLMPATAHADITAPTMLPAQPISDAALSTMRATHGQSATVVAMPAAPTMQLSAVRLWDEIIPPVPAPKPQQNTGTHLDTTTNLHSQQLSVVHLSVGPVRH
ncbi:hypothetical protein PTE30175_01946 [Pandoraea terrae]|uniref:Uncharacterized protein n=2 Tax=Pandoraea terrae TaxID=1537710 RepID=A0A5E4UF89_9BURK|nr:hypothetical protein PTE30175_01946 [Pandoraea terrae]